ncbi:epoxide hydrolase family protein [Limobrevibacterium gyesilva]|uniref:Epoxide hydrolase n=1 Tax=Limobrevibacterium gyesilva TaxID=2991712 RepID=A0AA41YNP8_9PROT|nr:epoxide hydrolase family protein [Limobrevibacterium gyesilva]MCW3475732.1 epoxide hydrolase [Limobrevibacterium gyesilva]
MQVSPFEIRIPAAELEDLKARLARTRWPDEVNDADWSYGTRLDFLHRLVGYWQDGFDWRAQEARLNALPQFIADIDGLPIHFVHARGAGPRPFPLVITHGWPGSFAEMEDIVPMLADPAQHGADEADAFDVVVPSLPGYGFSGHSQAPGFGPPQVAELWAKLMTGLGYGRFGVQGGDWGASVSSWLAATRPDLVAAIHLNFTLGAFLPGPEGPQPPLSAAERTFLAQVAAWRDAEGGYNHIQGTKPQTLAYGLNDSPAGLAAWIGEKFHSWSDCDGDIERAFSLDAVLTNISIYWFTQTIASSVRIYKESRRTPLNFAGGLRITPPLGFAAFPKEIVTPPRDYVARVFDVQRWTSMPRGGHFAAMEQPALLAQDIRAFFRPFRG